MSASDLKKELKALRKTHCPPVSKMKKTDVEKEVARLKGHTPTHIPVEKEEDKKARVTAVKEKKVAKVAAKLEEVKKSFEPVKAKSAPKKSVKIDLSGKEKETPPAITKKEAPAPAPVQAKAPRPAKGSQEAKDRMAAIRALRGKKPTE